MNESHRQLAEIGDGATTALLKASPPIAVAAADAGGMTLEQWVLVATLAYIALQAAHLAWKWYRDLRRAAREDAADA